MFQRLSTVEVIPRPDVQPELVAWRLVRLFSRQQDSGLKQRCGGLAHSLAHWHPPIRDLLMARRRELDKAVQGIDFKFLINIICSFYNRYNKIT